MGFFPSTIYGGGRGFFLFLLFRWNSSISRATRPDRLGGFSPSFAKPGVGSSCNGRFANCGCRLETESALRPGQSGGRIRALGESKV